MRYIFSNLLALLEVLLMASPTESRALGTLAKSKNEKSTGNIGGGQFFEKSEVRTVDCMLKIGLNKDLDVVPCMSNF